MSTAAWKDLERRVCRALGTRRRGQVAAGGWAQGSDDDGSGAFSVECKRTVKYQLRQAWIAQARRQGKADGRPWLLVVAQHNDRRPLAVVEFDTLVELAYRAGYIDERRWRLERAVGPHHKGFDVDSHLDGVEQMLEDKDL